MKTSTKGSKINTFLKIFDKFDDLDKLITIALSTSNGNREMAAKKLGISVRTLQRHIRRRIDIDDEEKRAATRAED